PLKPRSSGSLNSGIRDAKSWPSAPRPCSQIMAALAGTLGSISTQGKQDIIFSGSGKPIDGCQFLFVEPCDLAHLNRCQGSAPANHNPVSLAIGTAMTMDTSLTNPYISTHQEVGNYQTLDGIISPQGPLNVLSKIEVAKLLDAS